jgi:hypothetical protein
MTGTGIGMSLFLIAVGAILLAAVDYTVTGIDIKAIGAILVGVGAIGLLVSLVVVMGFFGAHADDGHHTADHV